MKLKKVMATTLATMMCLSSFSMMNVWADKKEDSEPLVDVYKRQGQPYPQRWKIP